MKDLLPTDRYGLEQLVIQLLIPGALALLPWAWALYIQHGAVAQFMLQHTGLAAVALFLASVAMGMVLVNLGSRVELHIYDADNGLTFSPAVVERVWQTYLEQRVPKDDTLVAQHYLSTILLRMRFELSMAFALLSVAAGVQWLDGIKPFIRPGGFLFYASVLAPIGGAVYFFIEGASSSEILHNTRMRILAAAFKQADGGTLPSVIKAGQAAQWSPDPFNPARTLRVKVHQLNGSWAKLAFKHEEVWWKPQWVFVPALGGAWSEAEAPAPNAGDPAPKAPPGS